MSRTQMRLRCAATVSLVACITACGNFNTGERLAGVAGAAFGGNLPTTDLEQTYYLGVFDPQEQLPPTIYRVRVRGQAGALSSTQYASGWVKAEVIDSLTSTVSSGNGAFTVTADGEQTAKLSTGRRLVLFGPEGFRESPKDHRLVIAMGSDPGKFFAAVDETLGVVAAATQGRGNAQMQQDLFRDITQLKAQRDRLGEIQADVAPKGTR